MTLQAFLCDDEAMQPPALTCDGDQLPTDDEDGIPGRSPEESATNCAAAAAAAIGKPRDPCPGIATFAVEQTGLRVRTVAATALGTCQHPNTNTGSTTAPDVTAAGGELSQCSTSDWTGTPRGGCSVAVSVTSQMDPATVALGAEAVATPTRSRTQFGQLLPGGLLSSLRKTASDVVSQLRSLGSGSARSSRTASRAATPTAQLASQRASVDSAWAAAAAAAGGAGAADGAGGGAAGSKGAVCGSASRRTLQPSPLSTSRATVHSLFMTSAPDDTAWPHPLPFPAAATVSVASAASAQQQPPPSPAALSGAASASASPVGRPPPRPEGSLGDSLAVPSSWLAGVISSSLAWGPGGRDSAGSGSMHALRAGASVTPGGGGGGGGCFLDDPQQGSLDLLPDMWDLTRVLDEVDDGFPVPASVTAMAAAAAAVGGNASVSGGCSGRPGAAVLTEMHTAPAIWHAEEHLGGGGGGGAARPTRPQSQQCHPHLGDPQATRAHRGLVGAAAAAVLAVASPRASGSIGALPAGAANCAGDSRGALRAVMPAGLRGHDAEQLYVLSELVQQARASASSAAAAQSAPRARFHAAQPTETAVVAPVMAPVMTDSEQRRAAPKLIDAAAWLETSASPYDACGFQVGRGSRSSHASGGDASGRSSATTVSSTKLASAGAAVCAAAAAAATATAATTTTCSVLPRLGCAASGRLAVADPLCASAPPRLCASPSPGCPNSAATSPAAPSVLPTFQSSVSMHFGSAAPTLPTSEAAHPGATAGVTASGDSSPFLPPHVAATVPAPSPCAGAGVGAGSGPNSAASSAASPVPGGRHPPSLIPGYGLFGGLTSSSGPLGSTSSLGLLETGPELSMMWPLLMPTPVPAILVGGAQDDRARCAGRPFLLNVLVACGCGCGSPGRCTASANIATGVLGGGANYSSSSAAAAAAAAAAAFADAAGCVSDAGGLPHPPAALQGNLVPESPCGPSWAAAAGEPQLACLPGSARALTGGAPAAAAAAAAAGAAFPHLAVRPGHAPLPRPPSPLPLSQRTSISAMLSGVQLAQVQLDRGSGAAASGGCTHVGSGGQTAMLRLPLLPAMQLVNVFAASGADVGPAASLLAVPPPMASELQAMFVDKVEQNLASLLAEERAPPRGAAAAMTAAGAIRNDRKAALAAQVRRELLALRESSPSAPPWTMSVPVWAACRAEWRSWMQPLLHDICYLLLCVPTCFAHGLVEWDRAMYCETLARLLGQLERYKLWQTISVLLEFCTRQGVALLYQGEAVGAGSLSAEHVRSLLEGALYDEISIKAVGLAAATGGVDSFSGSGSSSISVEAGGAGSAPAAVGGKRALLAGDEAVASEAATATATTAATAAAAALAAGRGRRASVVTLVPPDGADAAAALTLQVWRRRSVDTTLSYPGTDGARAVGGPGTPAGTVSASRAGRVRPGAERPAGGRARHDVSEPWGASAGDTGGAAGCRGAGGSSSAQQRTLPSQASIGRALGRVLAILARSDESVPAVPAAAAAASPGAYNLYGYHAGPAAGPPEGSHAGIAPGAAAAAAAAGATVAAAAPGVAPGTARAVPRLGHVIENAAAVLAFAGLMLQSLL